MGKKLIEKIDGIVDSLRDELERNDGSTLQAIFTNARRLGGGLVGAVKAGDRKLSSRILQAMDKRIKKYKAKEDIHVPADPVSEEAVPAEPAADEAGADEATVKSRARAVARPKASAKPKTSAKPKARPKTSKAGGGEA